MNFKYLLFFSVMVIGFSCAKISSPTGGTKDRIPPRVIKSVPANGTLDFHGKELLITFDEFVVLDNINEKLMVSPPMAKKPSVFTRGKTIHVEYEEKLKDSTTYTFYFMDAIKDLNEGNILDDYRFVFSTGHVIDSLSVTGNVYNALTLDIPEKTTVLLYSDLSDSAVIKNLPDYLTRVDPTGYFRIDNMRKGSYRMFALKDDDNSKTYNRVEEAFAFNDSLINVTPETNYYPVRKDTAVISTAQKQRITIKQETKNAGKESSTTRTNTSDKNGVKSAKKPAVPILTGKHKLILFTGLKKARYLTKSSRDQNYKLTYVLSVPPDTMDYRFSIPDVAEDRYLIAPSKQRDTITVWLRDSSLYNSQSLITLFRYPFTDSTGANTYKEDTIQMRFIAPRATRGTKKVKPVLLITGNIKNGIMKPGQKVVLRTDTPLEDPDTTRIRLYEIVEKEKTRLPFTLLHDTSDFGKLTLDATFYEGRQYLFIADTAAFHNIYGLANDSIGTRFSVKAAETYGRLTLDIDSCQSSCIIQLLDSKEKVLAEKKISRDGRIDFPLLEKGVYRVRVIYDLNDDGMWTTGDYALRRQPEPVSYYPGEIDIKEGWEADQYWNVKRRNIKDEKLRQKAASK